MKNPVEPIESKTEPERTMADLYPEAKPKPPKVHRMRDDFRDPRPRRPDNPFGKLTDAEFERERRRLIRRDSSWMARGRGY